MEAEADLAERIGMSECVEQLLLRASQVVMQQARVMQASLHPDCSMDLEPSQASALVAVLDTWVAAGRVAVAQFVAAREARELASARACRDD